MTVTMGQAKRMYELGIKERQHDGQFQFKKLCKNRSCSERVEDTCYCAATVERAIAQAQKERSSYHHSTECLLADDKFWDREWWEISTEWLDGSDTQDEALAFAGFNTKDLPNTPDDRSDAYDKMQAVETIRRIRVEKPDLYKRIQKQTLEAWNENYDGHGDDGECDCSLAVEA